MCDEHDWSVDGVHVQLQAKRLGFTVDRVGGGAWRTAAEPGAVVNHRADAIPLAHVGLDLVPHRCVLSPARLEDDRRRSLTANA
jgi:hypothetical protein